MLQLLILKQKNNKRWWKSLQDRVVGAAQTTGKFTSDQVDKVKEKVDDMGDDARVK